MAWRTIVIANPARIRVENSQLLIIQDEVVPLPIEDIGILLLESPEVVLTSSLLSRLAENDVMLLVCNNSHLPCMAGLPFAGHSRLTGIQRLQLGTSLPFKKRCWQAIIRQKIANQAECLRLAGRKESDKLTAMIGDIASGDSTNVESRAAREHFKRLFGEGFIRGCDDAWNAALNYGYAIIRAAVARALASHGFLLTQGLHHKSELNPFNLADDFIEPLRPVVDLYVCKNVKEDEEGLHRSHREELVSLLHNQILIDGKKHSVFRAADIMASSFIAACREKSAGELKLPELLPLKQHTYE